jgi:hypothetical protein
LPGRRQFRLDGVDCLLQGSCVRRVSAGFGFSVKHRVEFRANARVDGFPISTGTWERVAKMGKHNRPEIIRHVQPGLASALVDNLWRPTAASK